MSKNEEQQILIYARLENKAAWLHDYKYKRSLRLRLTESRLPFITTARHLLWASLRVCYLLPFLVVSPELLRHRLQRRIELHECMLDGGVRVVARPAWVPMGHRAG